MSYLATALAIFVALQHLGFLVLEMFLWTKPFGLKTFGLKREFAEESKALAANQGLYNGFLAAGIVYGVVRGPDVLTTFMLACVVVAGIFGAATVKRSILFVQAVPASIALLVRFLA